MPLDNLTPLILGSAAIGTAAFGLVEAAKGSPIGLIGLHLVKRALRDQSGADGAYGVLMREPGRP